MADTDNPADAPQPAPPPQPGGLPAPLAKGFDDVKNELTKAPHNSSGLATLERVRQSVLTLLKSLDTLTLVDDDDMALDVCKEAARQGKEACDDLDAAFKSPSTRFIRVLLKGTLSARLKTIKQGKFQSHFSVFSLLDTSGAAPNLAAAATQAALTRRGGTKAQSGGNQLWRSEWAADPVFGQYMRMKPGDASFMYCACCVLDLAGWQRVTNGRLAELAVGPAAVKALRFLQSHKHNGLGHLNNNTEHKARVNEMGERATDTMTIVDDHVKRLLRSGHGEDATAAAADDDGAADADPFAGLSETERAKWEKGHALIFHLQNVLIRRPSDRLLCAELVHAVNRTMTAMGVRHPSHPARGLPSSSGVARPVPTNAAPDPIVIDSDSADVRAGSGSNVQAGGNAGNARNSSGGDQCVSTSSATTQPKRAHPGLGMQPGVLQFGRGHLSSWSNGSVSAAFGAVAEDEVKRELHRCRFFSLDVDEVVQYGTKAVSIVAHLVHSGVPSRVTYVLDVTTSAPDVGDPAVAAAAVRAAEERLQRRANAVGEPPAAERLCDAIIECLELKYGLSSNAIDQKLVAVHVDGAHVNTGAHGGLVQRLSQHLGRPLHMVHCVAHCTSLIGSIFVSGPNAQTLANVPADDKILIQHMRDISSTANAAGVASHIGSIDRVHEAVKVELRQNYAKVPTLAPTRYFIIAPVVDVLLEQWAALHYAARAADKGEFKEWGSNAGILLLTCAMQPAFRVFNGLCKFGQSSSAHVGSLPAKLAAVREQLVRLYGIKGDGSSGNSGNEAGGGGGGFSGEAFERLRHYSTLKADGGALVINAHGILAVWVGGARDPNPFKRYKAWGGCVRGGAVMHEQLPDLVERVKAAAQNIVRLMLKEVDRRFPKCRTVGALAIGDLSYWHGIKASGEDHSHLEHAAHTIAAAFRTRDSPRFDLDLLIAQAPAFHDKLTTYSAHFLHSPAEERLALGGAESLSFDAAAEEASKEYPATATDKLWKVISELPDVSIDCSEWLKWVRLTYAVVLGTNDNERAHSRMKLLRTALRSGLRLEHLVNALRVVLHPKEIGPRRAFALWVVGRREVGERQVGQKRARDV